VVLAMRFAFVFCALALALLCSAAPAAAQARDAAAAEVLFSEGRSAFDAGEYFTACPKFEESQRLDPAAGTLINLAACYEKLGKLASAWETWREALRYLNRQDDRYPVVDKRAQALESRLPRLEIKLAAGTPPGANVTRDGVPLGAASLGVSLPVDPGKHVVVASAPQHEQQQYAIDIREGEHKSLVVEPGNAVATGAAPAAPATATGGSAAPAPARDTQPGSPARKTLGFVVGGIGVIGLAAGAVTGLIALDRKNTVRDHCQDSGGRLLCDQEGLDAAESGSTFATLSTVSFAVGALATGAGVWLVMTSDESSTRVGARPLPGGGALAVVSRF
jgi:hypothetical protein